MSRQLLNITCRHLQPISSLLGMDKIVVNNHMNNMGLHHLLVATLLVNSIHLPFIITLRDINNYYFTCEWFRTLIPCLTFFWWEVKSRTVWHLIRCLGYYVVTGT